MEDSTAQLIDRLFGSPHFPPALLVVGPAEAPGEVALAIARRLLHEKRDDLTRHPDFLLITAEKETIRIEAVREIGRRLSMEPLEGDRVAVLIDRADRMNEATQNALLKTLEEPPPFAHFLLVTAIPDRLLPTIRSRCRRLSLAEPGLDGLREQASGLLTEQNKNLLALLNEERSFTEASLAAREAAEGGRPGEVIALLKAWWHDLAVFAQKGEARALLFPAEAPRLGRWLEGRRAGRPFDDYELILETERALEGNVNKTLALERLFFRLMP